MEQNFYDNGLHFDCQRCSSYPFWSWMIADKNTWNECARDCPGMNRGRLWTKEQIVKAAKQSDENIPITKEEVMLLINAQQEC